MTRRRLSLLLLVAALATAAWAGLGRSDLDRIHRAVFGLALADRYPLVTRTVTERDVTYLFWSPDDVATTCATLAAGPEGWMPAGDCTYVARLGDRVEVTSTAAPAATRGGSLVEVIARLGP